jgi:hypothetical protein
LYYLQFHFSIGSSRQIVLKNRDAVKDLQVGMLIAVDLAEPFPRIEKVQSIPPNATMETQVLVYWPEQERHPTNQNGQGF